MFVDVWYYVFMAMTLHEELATAREMLESVVAAVARRDEFQVIDR